MKPQGELNLGHRRRPSFPCNRKKNSDIIMRKGKMQVTMEGTRRGQSRKKKSRCTKKLRFKCTWALYDQEAFICLILN